ncbi:PulJ/GspJ family protein [Sulfitobacter sp. JB4-11]|uniref:PulJ/GspJ family protein n=1 Tax=Sulfitobacter rhodophyticola TaxID=3238304 RepID=UPI003514E1FD
MTVQRKRNAGVTLIEMLAALAVSALIGVAGFTLLESVLQTEAGVAGHLDALEQQDRTFQLLALDLQQALGFEDLDDNGIALEYVAQRIVWQGTGEGVERRIVFADRADLVQRPLSIAAQFRIEGDKARVLTVSLPQLDLWRVFHLPPQNAP